MKFIDTHLHLQDYKASCATDIIHSAAKNCVEKLVVAAVVEKDWQVIAGYCRDYPGQIIPAFGLHPWYLDEAEEGWEQRLSKYLDDFPAALIGESGLDKLKNSEAEPQNCFFKTHIDLAKKYRRPLIVHAVRAQSWLEGYWSDLPQKFVLHSYNGKPELLQVAAKAGGYISFSGSILNHPDCAKIIKAVPSDRILVETDGPGNRGAEVTPAQIPELVSKIAVCRGIEAEVLADTLYQNSLEFIKPW